MRQDSADGRYELAIVIPTYNERDNIARLLDRLSDCLAGLRWQTIVVDDDSPDGTADVVKEIAARKKHVRCIHRVGRRGLAGAVAEGIHASNAPVAAVIDADLQHDEKALPDMLAMLKKDTLDLVVCSRFFGQRVPEGLSRLRKWGSHTANAFATMMLGTRLSDPMSGFFMVRRETFDAVAERLYPEGFKILFNLILASPSRLRIGELGVDFSPRTAGESKLDMKIVIDFLSLLLWHRTGRIISPRIVPFAMVGGLGLIVHLSVLQILQDAAFSFAQFVAILVSMSFNYVVNNLVTYRDKRKAGWAFVSGYVRFCMACTFGAVANYSVAIVLAFIGLPEWVAGMTGALVGGMWNFLAASRSVW